ncbi:hypothetical protein HKD24_01340 [Gluconobacter sp. LMG 31484]|uniref:Uncharacterized protein n=1 Tax=Gluconobacter vitians TaxID=2728102 RepID=A0ABR9Y297_9PROT|nr:hypothetical protein [Gluconobacter vitians]MBF0857861.1 hypothetical protein [Gluconobacter vitians]
MSIRFLSFSASLLVAGVVLMPTAMAADTAEKPCETDLCRSVRQSWASVRHGTSDAADWTRKQSEKGWDATKNGVSHAAHWTGRESEKGWKATKNGTKEVVHDTGAWTKRTAHDLDPRTSDKAPDAKTDASGQ